MRYEIQCNINQMKYGHHKGSSSKNYWRNFPLFFGGICFAKELRVHFKCEKFSPTRDKSDVFAPNRFKKDQKGTKNLIERAKDTLTNKIYLVFWAKK